MSKDSHAPEFLIAQRPPPEHRQNPQEVAAENQRKPGKQTEPVLLDLLLIRQSIVVQHAACIERSPTLRNLADLERSEWNTPMLAAQVGIRAEAGNQMQTTYAVRTIRGFIAVPAEVRWTQEPDPREGSVDLMNQTLGDGRQHDLKIQAGNHLKGNMPENGTRALRRRGGRRSVHFVLQAGDQKLGAR